MSLTVCEHDGECVYFYGSCKIYVSVCIIVLAWIFFIKNKKKLLSQRAEKKDVCSSLHGPWPVCPFSYHINKAFSSTQLLLTGYFLLLWSFPANPDSCTWKSQMISSSQWNCLQPVWHRPPGHFNALLNLSKPSSPHLQAQMYRFAGMMCVFVNVIKFDPFVLKRNMSELINLLLCGQNAQ